MITLQWYRLSYRTVNKLVYLKAWNASRAFLEGWDGMPAPAGALDVVVNGVDGVDGAVAGDP